MGIDIYLTWKGKSEGDRQVYDGKHGYLREAYHGGPYATKLFVREAFEQDSEDMGDGRHGVPIPASVLRERLTNPVEPIPGAEPMDAFVSALAAMFGNAGMRAEFGATTAHGKKPVAATVEEAVAERERSLYNGTEDDVRDAIQSYRDFVDLAERMEAETGEACYVYASY